MKRLIQKTVNTVRQKGIHKTLHLVGFQIFYYTRYLFRLCKKLNPSYFYKKQRWMQRDRAFDRDYGIDTTGDIQLSRLDIKSENVQHGVLYGPTPRGVYGRLIDYLDTIHFPYQDFTFLDLGAGKGRALFLASERPYQRLIGVEFSHELVASAEDNLLGFKSPHQQCHNFQFICQDVTDYKLPAENLLIYMYNAFDDVLLKKVLIQIEDSFQKNPRKIVLVYLNPKYRELFLEHPFLSNLTEQKSFSIFVADPPKENT